LVNEVYTSESVMAQVKSDKIPGKTKEAGVKQEGRDHTQDRDA